MKKEKLPVFFIAGLVLIFVTVLGFLIFNDGTNSNRNYPRLEYTKPDKNNTPLKQDLLQSEKSGAATSMPWENDPGFKKKQTESNTPILMAGYRTVLRDPLPGEEYNVHLAAQMLAGTTVTPGKIFSQNGKLGPYTESRGFKAGPTYIGSNLTVTIGGGVCKIASTLYNVTVLSGLNVVERHAHGMPVPYVPYGQDATVSYGAQDFKFKNITEFPVLIWAQGIDNVLYIGFYGNNKPPNIEWHHEMLEVRKAKNIYKNNPDLPPGSKKKLSDGMDGALVKSSITIEKSDGTRETRQMGVSSYMPMPYIFEFNR